MAYWGQPGKMQLSPNKGSAKASHFLTFGEASKSLDNRQNSSGCACVILFSQAKGEKLVTSPLLKLIFRQASTVDVPRHEVLSI